MRPLIVITPPAYFPGEARLLGRLLEESPCYLHIRKPGSQRAEMAVLLEEIDPAYRKRISLHDHFDLAIERSLGGIHLNGRHPEAPPSYHGRISRSCHSLAEVERYKPACNYVFLSPIFPSLSKEGYGSGFSLDRLRQAGELIDGRVIALGGISRETLPRLRGIPFGGVAVVGALWGADPARLEADQLITRFKQLQDEIPDDGVSPDKN